jgi:hypothetical protein
VQHVYNHFDAHVGDDGKPEAGEEAVSYGCRKEGSNLSNAGELWMSLVFAGEDASAAMIG